LYCKWCYLNGSMPQFTFLDQRDQPMVAKAARPLERIVNAEPASHGHLAVDSTAMRPVASHHILRNHLHVLDEYGKERAQASLPKYAADMVTRYMETDSRFDPGSWQSASSVGRLLQTVSDRMSLFYGLYHLAIS